MDGGSKVRFLPYLCRGAKEVVYGSPFCGGAAVALAVLGRYTGQKMTIFYAARKELHRRQREAEDNGANLKFERPGYMTVIQKRARDYADKTGALFLPLGFDVPEAQAPFLEVMGRVRKKIGSPGEIWCATGSGMLTRCLGHAFPESAIMGVAVGLRSKHGAQAFPPNVQIINHHLKFEQEEKRELGVPACPNYDRKALAYAVERAKPGALFWNVMG